MKNHTIVFTRTDASAIFPNSTSPEVAAHVKTTYVGNPLKFVGMSSVISANLLTLTITRNFATEADATEYSQDPVIVAWIATLPITSAGLTA